jgi:tRNA threonylcarbamoyladenosine biosynthesis protein TsaB
MPIILAIETAGSACSVAVGRGDRVIAYQRRDMRYGHGEALLPTIDSVMKDADLPPAAIEAVAVSVGPGGFTGIRVGLAAAQGIALATGARLVGITSFAAVAARTALAEDAVLLVALDSRRTDLYVQLFGPRHDPLDEPRALLPDQLAAYVATSPLLIAGDAAEAAAALIDRPGITIVAHSAPDARGVLAGARRISTDAPVRPLYLRPPDVTFPRPSAAARLVP